MTDQLPQPAGQAARFGLRVPTPVLAVIAALAVALFVVTLVIALMVTHQPDLVPIPVASASRA